MKIIIIASRILIFKKKMVVTLNGNTILIKSDIKYHLSLLIVLGNKQIIMEKQTISTYGDTIKKIFLSF